MLSSRLNAQQANQYNSTTVYQLFQNQDYEKAASYLVSVNKHAENLQYRLDLGYAYYMLNKFSDSKIEYEKAFQTDSTNIQANLYLASIYNRQRLPELALSHYMRMVNMHPDNYRYWQYASSAAYTLNEFDSSFYYITKSYALKPTSSSVVHQYAEALQKKKMTEVAEKVVNTFLETDPTDEIIIAKKIDISFYKNNYADVILWGERLVNTNALTPSAYTKLLFSYLNTGNLDKCIQLYDWLEARNMGNESAKYGAALAYARKKNFTVSNELLQQCLENNILTDAILYLRAKANNYEALKDYKKAIAYYDTSYYIFQKPIDLYFAGTIYDHTLKNKAKATEYYRLYQKKSGKPKTNTELQIAGYIKEYLMPKAKK